MYFAERTLPKRTSSTSEGLMFGTRSKAAGEGWYSSCVAQGVLGVHLIT